jgi:hypothetical protein
MIEQAMQKYRQHPRAGEPAGGEQSSAEAREIVIPFATAVVPPLSAVRNVLIQASFAELKAYGHYERYAKLIASDALEQLLALAIAPSWIPIRLALAHYEACERLQLSESQFSALGKSVGDRLQEVVLISSAKKAEPKGYDLWQGVGALHRMWPRVYQGGGVQVVKIGPKAMLYEARGFSLNRFDYYRQGHVSALHATHSALGAHVTSVRVVHYNAANDDMTTRIDWT